jgi:D-serine deaminase-like pyridoxal phosphate-dependent protein
MELPYPQGLKSYIGKHKTQLPSPSLCLSVPIIKENARLFHEACEKSGLSYRAHLKTNKVGSTSKF